MTIIVGILLILIGAKAGEYYIQWKYGLAFENTW